MSLDVTVAICTWNRRALLESTLATLAELAVPSDAAWELVIVDNGSSDDTAGLVSQWTRKHSAIYFIIFRTLFNIIAVFVFLLLEKAFESRHEYGGFGSSLSQIFQHRDVYHVWANVTVVSIAVFWFNVILYCGDI